MKMATKVPVRWFHLSGILLPLRSVEAFSNLVPSFGSLIGVNDQTKMWKSVEFARLLVEFKSLREILKHVNVRWHSSYFWANVEVEVSMQVAK